MKWLALAGNVVGEVIDRIPFEKFLIRPKDRQKALNELREILEPPKSQKERPPHTTNTSPVEETEEVVVLRPRSPSKVHLEPPPTNSVSTEETVAYHNHEIDKHLNELQTHYAQKLVIAGKKCDCGSGNHLLHIEALAEATIAMVDNPEIYYRLLDWVKEVSPKSTDQAAKSGQYDNEYPIFSRQARDFRKELPGFLERVALSAKKGEDWARSRVPPQKGEIEVETPASTEKAMP